MIRLRILACLVLCTGALTALPFAQQDGDAITAKSGEFEISVARILAGTWSESRPSAQGASFVEEIWSAPHGDNVVGSFRWLGPDGKASMYELLTITQEQDGVFLRLRHFGPSLEAWEERDEPKTLRLTEATKEKLVFVGHAHCADLAGVTYERPEPNVLAIEVAFVEESSRAPLQFRLERAE